jgi:hypothetical protein
LSFLSKFRALPEIQVIAIESSLGTNLDHLAHILDPMAAFLISLASDGKRALMQNKGSSHDGQRIYTSALLRVYDLWVLGISNSLIWKCPTRKMVAHYNTYVSAHHLDVGVGTGYYLDHCKFPVKKPKITLADLNRNSLEWSAKRIRRYEPEIAKLDVFESSSFPQSPFHSIGIQYLLHCLPGDMKDKEKVFTNLKPHLSVNGVIFGATILGKELERSKAAKKLMRFYNSKRVFSNEQDSLSLLNQVLRDNFRRVSIETHGCVALFSARL